MNGLGSVPGRHGQVLSRLVQGGALAPRLGPKPALCRLSPPGGVVPGGAGAAWPPPGSSFGHVLAVVAVVARATLAFGSVAAGAAARSPPSRGFALRDFGNLVAGMGCGFVTSASAS